jgi:hypothetical protein
MHTKKCITCKQAKPLTEFYTHRQTKDGYLTKCKECQKQSSLATWYRRQYGLTVEQARELCAGGCEICGAMKNLHIDHDHATGKVRGCLCVNCNQGLGHFRDNQDLLLEAIRYLRRT